MNAFLYPYNFRIMAKLRDDEPIELYRSRGRFEPSVLKLYTRDLDIKVWTWWVETTTSPYHLIGDRPKFKAPESNKVARVGLALKHDEKVRLDHDTPRLSFWT